MKLIPLTLAALTLLTPCLWAQTTQDVLPLDTGRVLRELEAAEKKQKDLANSQQQKKIQVLREALGQASSSASLYEEAIRATQFAGKDNATQQFSAWSKKNADLLRSDGMRQAIRFHVTYLLLSLQRGAENAEAADLAKPSLDYAVELAEAQSKGPLASPPKEASELLNKPVAEGIFARWLMIDGLRIGSGDWEQSAGNLQGILEKNVRGPWRNQRNPQLMQAWDVQLRFLEGRTSENISSTDLDQLKTRTIPAALFARANDLEVLGQPNRAATEILQLVRTHPSHPDWLTWVARLKGLIEVPPSTEPPPTPPSAE